MAPAQCPRQVLVWTLPALAVLISFFWFKRKKTLLRSDPGGTVLERSSEQVDIQSSTLNCVTNCNSDTVRAVIEKAKRDIETSRAIEEVVLEEFEDEEEEIVEITSKGIKDNKGETVIREEPEIKQTKSVQLSLPVSRKEEVLSETLNLSQPVKVESNTSKILDVDCNPAIGKNTSEEESIANTSGSQSVITLTDISFEETNSDSPQEILEISSDTTVSLESSPEKSIEFKEENNRLSPVSSKSMNQNKDVVIEETCVKKILNDTSNEVKVISSPNKNNKLNKVSGSKKRTNKKSVKENSNIKSNKAETKDSKKEDNLKDKKIYLNGGCSKEQITSCKHLSSSIKTDKVKDSNKMELACSRVEQSGHNSSSSTINGNEAGLEQKLATLGLESSHNSEGGERDSANHSPAEVMLASPSMSNFSDAHSEVSCCFCSY